MAAPDLILGSASPRRRELLEQLGLVLRIEPMFIDETPKPCEDPRVYTERLAAEKCARAVEQVGGDIPAVLAADTTVTVDGDILGKPRDASEAQAMLARLGGRRHDVITAYQFRCHGATGGRVVQTSVVFRDIPRDELAAYVASAEWQDKAGGYAIQGAAAVFVSEIMGSFTNVIGLPLAEVIADLRAAGALAGWPPAALRRVG
jgi:septum formation protein